MTASEEGEELSAFVKSITTLVDRRTAAYAELFGAPVEPRGRLRPARPRWPNEPELLEHFEFLAVSVIARYEPPGVRRRGDSLVFGHVYAQARPARPGAPARTEVPVDLLAALLAAEVEFRGPLRLSHTQNRLLAEVYELLGGALGEAGLPAHAALCFRRALFLHRANGDLDAEDRCGLAEARSRRRATKRGWRRATSRFSDLFCGYGYRPFRMLAWIAVQLALFTGLVTVVTGAPFGTNLYLCLTNYLNPIGLGDTSGVEQPARVLFVLEAYLGTISMSVFFALLVRRWFRL